VEHLLFDTKPVQDIGHKCLESHVLHTSNILCTLEILRCSIKPTLSGVIDEVLHDEISGDWRDEDARVIEWGMEFGDNI
jgi:hypothetical protein